MFPDGQKEKVRAAGTSIYICCTLTPREADATAELSPQYYHQILHRLLALDSDGQVCYPPPIYVPKLSHHPTKLPAWHNTQAQIIFTAPCRYRTPTHFICRGDGDNNHFWPDTGRWLRLRQGHEMGGYSKARVQGDQTSCLIGVNRHGLSLGRCGGFRRHILPASDGSQPIPFSVAEIQPVSCSPCRMRERRGISGVSSGMEPLVGAPCLCP